MLKPDNVFTWKEHYVVLIDINDQGRIELMDTDSTHREKDSLQYCFENGFSKGDLLHRYSCAWIYDKASMPEEPFIYVPEPPAEISRYPDLVLSAEEKRMIAKLICTEAGGEPFRGQQAVAEVILNRFASGDFADTISGVVYAEGQFRSVAFLEDAEPYQAQYEAIDRAVHGPYVLPMDVVHFATYRTNNNVWGQIGGHIFCYQE
jgi:hypothetical protein